MICRWHVDESFVWQNERFRYCLDDDVREVWDQCLVDMFDNWMRHLSIGLERKEDKQSISVDIDLATLKWSALYRIVSFSLSTMTIWRRCQQITMNIDVVYKRDVQRWRTTGQRKDKRLQANLTDRFVARKRKDDCVHGSFQFSRVRTTYTHTHTHTHTHAYVHMYIYARIGESMNDRN
jgi:hypothetical protein